MKFALGLVVLSLSSFGGFAPDSRATDDPPPEPVDCPLCGGNPALHAARTFAIVDVGGEIAARVLLW